MVLPYFNALLDLNLTPSTDWKDDFQQYIDYEFENSSSVYDIEEELTFGTQLFTPTTVRVNHAINSTTGTKLGDDYRVFIFKDISHPKGLGYRYKFNNNTWLCMNSDLYKYVTASTTVRRCNNVIKWYDYNGVLRIEPCVIDYAYSGTQVDFDQTINTNSGNLVVSVQYNQFTSNIKINDRFLFGGQPYKVKSLNNFFQNETGIQNTTPLLHLTVYYDPVAVGDDIINNIPARQNDYTISLDTVSINQSIGYTTQLIATVKLNNEIVSESITWSSSNPLIATVNSSGNVTFISNGSCVINASMTNNLGVSVNCNITVQSTPTTVREIRFSPNVTELLQNTSQQYFAYLFVDGIQQANPVTFSYSGVTNDKYVISGVGANTFTLTNVKSSTTPITITGTSGVTNNSIQIKLKGLF